MAFFMQFFTMLSAFTISWFNTTVSIPVDDDLNSYIEIPYASVIDNGIEVEADYYQRNGVSFTFLSTVNTSIVRSYTVYYEAYFSVYNIRSTQAITFVIYDDINPVITRVPHYVMEVGDDPPDLSIGFIYQDNYDDVDDLIASIDDHQVNYNYIGNYEIIYHVMDTSFNETTRTGTLIIQDTSAPQIDLMEAIVIERCSNFNIFDYIAVYDTYDLSPNMTYDDSFILINEVGEYSITINATDQSGNASFLDTYVKVVDTTPPIIRLVSHPVPIAVFNDQVLMSLDQYVIDIWDGDTIIGLDQVHITHDIQIDRLGTYTINYSVEDVYGNVAQQSLEVDVIDETPPTIILKESLLFPVFGPDIFFHQYFDISDNYDDYATLIINIDTSPEYDEIGRYPIVVTAKDTSKNIAKYEGYIEIIDDIAPTVIQVSDIVITDFRPHVLMSYFDMTDNYDDIASLAIDIDDSLVVYDQIGIYAITVWVTDQSLNQTYLETEIFILDVTPPTLELLQTSMTLEVNESAMNLRSMILIAADNYDALTMDDVHINTHLDLNAVGMYDILYTLMDASGNETTCVLRIIVDDFTPPVIELSNLTIYQYDMIDLYANIVAYDDVSSSIIKCFPETIDTSQPGDQIITYIAQDARGNYTMKERMITILATPTNYEVSDFTPIIGIVILGSVILYTIKKRG